MSMFLWYGYEGSFLKRARNILEAGFSGASMWWEDEEGRNPLVNLAFLRSLGLEVNQVHLSYYPGGLWSKDAGAYVESFLKALEELNRGEVPLAVFHPATMEEMERPITELGLINFSRIYDRAKALGVELAGENLKSDNQLLSLLDNFDISLCLDTGHLGVSGNYNVLRNYFTRVRSLHLHDNDTIDDLHLIPGDGKLPLETWLEQIPRGIDLHLEINRGLNNHYQEMEEKDFLKRAKLSLDRLGGSLGR